MNTLVDYYLRGMYAEGAEHVSLHEEEAQKALKEPERQLWLLYHGLCLAELSVQADSTERESSLKRLVSLQTRLSSDQTDIGNFAAVLLSAERSRLAGNSLDAMRQYALAGKSVQTLERPFEQALVNEHAALLYRECGRERLAQGYWEEALAGYRRCGLEEKVVQLEALYPARLPRAEVGEQPERVPKKRSTTKTLTSIMPVTFDMMGVVKASQMISEEVRLNSLLRRLMQIVIEQAGATSGIFLAWQNGHLFVRARGRARPGSSPELIEEHIMERNGQNGPGTLSERDDLPVSLVNYVLRTRQEVILNDVTAERRFPADPYLNSTQPKALLCMPVLHHGTLDGVLYLENTLAGGAFTPEQVEVLHVLVSQAAISLENATVYEHLEQKVRERTAKLAAAKSRFQVLSEASFEGLLIHDRGRILEVNSTLERLTGYSQRDLLAMNVFELLTPASRPQAQQRLQGGNGDAFEAEAVKKDGAMFPVELQGRKIEWQDRQVNLVAIRDISVQHSLQKENRVLRASLDDSERFGELVGRSPLIRRVYDRLLQAAKIEMPVMIYGESGTGKELAARTLFSLSDHHDKLFLEVNCGAIPKHLFESQFFGYRRGAFTGAERDAAGYFEQAEGGTLFLDEVGEIPPEMQVKLLRALNNRTYTPVGATSSRKADVRIIAATNKNPRDLVQQGSMREDFFHRLYVIAVEMPPLRLRKEDLPLLVKHFLEHYCPEGTPVQAIPASLMKQFSAYEWPGNVRELYNELYRYVITGEVELGGAVTHQVQADEEMPFLRSGLPLREAVEAFETFYVNRAIAESGGRKTRAAASLKIDRSTLYAKLKNM